MNTNNNADNARFFSMTKGLTKIGADFFDNKVTGKNCIPVALSAIVAIPIFALAFTVDVVFGALKVMGNGLSLLAQRNVKVAPLPSAIPNVPILDRPALNDNQGMIRYFVKDNTNSDPATITFNRLVEDGFCQECPNFFRDLIAFEKEPSHEKAVVINQTYIVEYSKQQVNLDDAERLKMQELIKDESLKNLDVIKNYLSTKIADQVAVSLRDIYIQLAAVEPGFENKFSDSVSSQSTKKIENTVAADQFLTRTSSPVTQTFTLDDLLASYNDKPEEGSALAIALANFKSIVDLSHTPENIELLMKIKSFQGSAVNPSDGVVVNKKEIFDFVNENSEKLNVGGKLLKKIKDANPLDQGSNKLIEELRTAVTTLVSTNELSNFYKSNHEFRPTPSARSESKGLPPPPVASSEDLDPPPVPSLDPSLLSSDFVQNSVGVEMSAETLSSPVTVHTETK